MTGLPNFGPFQVERLLGQGGMARVWRAIHKHHDQAVAIKVMTAEQAREQRFIASFQREVRAVARMNHPNIVQVFDYGEVDAEMADLSAGQLVAGSPYMVMELADSTLSHVQHDRLHWSHIHTILVHILEALAHAHARELVHRDLKPDNVLFLSRGQRSHLKLSDFGVAYAINAMRQLRPTDERITGTPRYMAPEQIRGRLRDQGPWTDLYALGCLAYWLTAGQPPFSSDRIEEVLRSHLMDPRPALEATIEVPEGFERWTYRLLAREPSKRFQRAADAAAALKALAGEPPQEAMTLSATTADGSSVDLTILDDGSATRILDHSPGDDSAMSHRAHAVDVDDLGGVTLPALPTDWRVDRGARESMEMVGVGLDLFELREIPLVGRFEERDLLWENLLDARYTGRPHVVVLDGPPGIGKTRLATWLGHRAHEVGAVDVLTARHSPISGPGDGLSRMFANHIRCTGLERAEILERIRDFYGEDEALDGDDLHQCMALTDLLARGADPNFNEEAQTIRFGRPEERYLVWKRWLAKLGQKRPLLVVLDDIHWGIDSLRFVRSVIDDSMVGELPVLFVLTVRGDLIDEAQRAAGFLAEVVERPCAKRVPVGPLDAGSHRRLIEKLLRLEPTLAARIAARTEGNPLFAIQLVGDWIERGLLEVGDEGFYLAAAQEPPLPGDMRALLVQRLEKITGQSIEDEATPALLSLELAAVLGHDVEEREWRQLCDNEGIEVPDGLLDRLAGQSLVQLDDKIWSFAHGAVRETLLAIAESQGRRRAHHRRCAQMLRDCYSVERDELAPRLSRHLLAAHDYEAALDPLYQSLRYYVDTSDFDAAEAYLERYQGAQRELGLAEDHEHAIRAQMELAFLYGRQFDLHRCDQLLADCREKARPDEHPDLFADILFLQSSLKTVSGSDAEALEIADRARQHCESHGDDYGVARVALAYGKTYSKLHRTDQALAYLEEARTTFRDLEKTDKLVECIYYLAVTYLRMGNYKRASGLYRRAMDMYEKRGDRIMVAACFNGLGDVYRERGSLRQGETMYRRALEVYERVGIDPRTTVSYHNMGLNKLQEKAFDEARSYMEVSLKEERSRGRSEQLAMAHAGVMACEASRERWEAYDTHLSQTTAHLEQLSYGVRDVAVALHIGADLARDRGQIDRAHAAYRAACEQWRYLDISERVEAIEAELRHA